MTEMNIIKESLGGERITVSRRYCKNGHRLAPPAPDSENASLYMDEYWNWCVLDGCRQIVKSGRIFMKSKLRGQYKYVNSCFLACSRFTVQCQAYPLDLNQGVLGPI